MLSNIIYRWNTRNTQIIFIGKSTNIIILLEECHISINCIVNCKKHLQAELVDVIDEDIAGARPIQVIGYIGITRPKRATRWYYNNKLN